jgi:ABC-2 type transport system ATP-binding protein|tara:strand:+ start:2888 stop:3883 length:996 start_codon:yes stop_codon:yes gene_type:complete
MSNISNSSSAIRLEKVSKRYGRTVALDQVNFEVKEQQMFALLGPNGAGKTTLMHILSTLLRPDAGRAFVAGVDVISKPLQARQRLGIVFQEPSLDDRLSVHENLDLHGLIFGVPRTLRRQRIEELLALVELTDWTDKIVRTLSSGMKRRLEIARSFIHDSEILLLDEPTVGLDAQTRDRIWHYIHRLQSERKITVLVTTHYIEEVEQCDQVCIIDNGKVLADGAPKALKQQFGQQLLRIVPKTEKDQIEIVTRYAGRLSRVDGTEIILTSDDKFSESFLAENGARIRALSIEVPSLESVFLTLTGRDIRDKEINLREQTKAFGKIGGEHTR